MRSSMLPPLDHDICLHTFRRAFKEKKNSIFASHEYDEIKRRHHAALLHMSMMRSRGGIMLQHLAILKRFALVCCLVLTSRPRCPAYARHNIFTHFSLSCHMPRSCREPIRIINTHTHTHTHTYIPVPPFLPPSLPLSLSPNI
jgi:hypothetical protein